MGIIEKQLEDEKTEEVLDDFFKMIVISLIISVSFLILIIIFRVG